MRERSGDFFVVDAMEAHTSFPGLCCPKPRRALDILCRVVYTGSSKKTEEQGSAEWYRKTG